MVKKAVVRVAARGYVDGRYIGEEKDRVDVRGDDRGDGRKRRGAKTRGGDDIGNKIGSKKRGRRAPGTGMAGVGAAQPRARAGDPQGAKRGKRRPAGRTTEVRPALLGNAPPLDGNRGSLGPRTRKNRTGKKTPFRSAVPPQSVSISAVAEARRFGDEAKSGQFAEALQREAVIKRERLHKVLAQSGIGSRRDMEILISSGRVMVNGIVASTGTSVSAADNVLVDHRPVKLKFNEELPRVLLYHKPEGEIVSTDDPGNRITVFDNLPRVENGKWVAIGRLDINTSGLLIFTTNGELANRMMHPRYEVEREYAVRILGELTEAQTETLLGGVAIEPDEEAQPEWEAPMDDDALPLSAYGEPDDDEGLDHLDGLLRDEDDEVAFHDATDDGPPKELSAEELAARRVDDPDFEPGDEQPPMKKVATKARRVIPAGPRLARFDSIDARGGEGANHWYHVVLREGRNREVRKMFESQGLTVSRLIRVRFGKVILPPRLARGRLVELEAGQVRAVMKEAGMEIDGPITKLETLAGSSRGGGAPASHSSSPPRGQRPPKGGSRGQAPAVGAELGDARAPRGRKRRGAKSQGSNQGPSGTMQGTGQLDASGIPDFSADDFGADERQPAMLNEGGPHAGPTSSARPPRPGRRRRGKGRPARDGGVMPQDGSGGVSFGDDVGNRVAPPAGEGGGRPARQPRPPGSPRPPRPPRPPRDPQAAGTPRVPGTEGGPAENKDSSTEAGAARRKRGRRNFRRGRGKGGGGGAGGGESGGSGVAGGGAGGAGGGGSDGN